MISWPACTLPAVHDIGLDTDGNADICGTTAVKYSTNGELLWHRLMHLLAWTPIATGRKLAVDAQGNVSVTAGDRVNRYSSDGRVLWRAV